MDQFIETFLRRREMLRNWRIWVNRIAGAAKLFIPMPKVYVIGSVVRGDYVASSDLDILIVSKTIPSSVRDGSSIKTLIEEELSLPYYHPFEIHLFKPDEASQYLRKAGRHVLRIR